MQVEREQKGRQRERGSEAVKRQKLQWRGNREGFGREASREMVKRQQKGSYRKRKCKEAIEG